MLKFPFISGCPFLAMGMEHIDVAVIQLTMRALVKVELFYVYRTLKLPSIYKSWVLLLFLTKQ